ncbi:MAG: hypothetical protein IKV87_07645 [Methanobrevibacter sp.]|nr:hypothetical protein [Methanobrevibacter sp.]
MLVGYLDDAVNYITGYSVSKDFLNLLNHYGLSRKDGEIIQKNIFAYDVIIPYDNSKNIIYDIWAFEEFKKLFIAYFKKKYPSKEIDLDYLNSYKVNEEFLNGKEEIIKLNAILEEYMGKDKLSKQYLNDLSEYNLLSSYFEITLRFYTIPLEEYENIPNLREYVLDYLKEISRKEELFSEFPQTMDELMDYIIINSNKEIIDFIYNHDEFNYDDRDSLKLLNLISNHFHIDYNPNLMMECYNSKYNDLRYAFYIKESDEEDYGHIIYLQEDKEADSDTVSFDYDDFSNYKFGAFNSVDFDSIIILNELREKIQNNYEYIIKTNFKDNFIETEFNYYIAEEIDEYSLDFLENLFQKEKYDELIRYYSLSKENGLKIKDKCYVYCFNNQDYETQLIRNYQIINVFYNEFRHFYNFLSFDNKKPLDKLYEYTNYKKLVESTKDYRINTYFKICLKSDKLCRILYNELEKRNLLDYYDCLDLYGNSISINSEEKIKELVDNFENTYDFSKPQSLNEAINYLIENTSRDFIDKVYNCEQRDMGRLHFSLGLFIRNEFGLFNHSNTRLMHDITYSRYCRNYLWADDYSGVILDELYDYVQENYDEIIKNTNFKEKIDSWEFWL